MQTNEWDLVCVSHLWWSWVWQRPQHLMSRMSREHRVFWTEEPHIEIGPPADEFVVTEEQPNLIVGKLVYRSDRDTFWERLNVTLDRTGGQAFKVPETITEASMLFGGPYQSSLEREVRSFVQGWQRNPLVLWLYTPAALPFVELLQPDLLVYDVMDELTAFKFALPKLKQQAQELMQRADLVFTGGPSLYAARKDLRDDVHLFPSGVEREHFAQALSDGLPSPADVSELPHPIVGFFGVIDERIDLSLLASVAAARPEYTWVLLGPILKIEEHDLPRLPNIHYLGKKEYRELPAYLHTFDVAMMPFAHNEATRFISPTKTLEYMAAHKPIVSTSIKDVVDLYGGVVRIADTPDTFVDAVDAALAEDGLTHEERIAQEETLLQRYAWDNIAGTMESLITDRLQRKRASS